MTSIEIEVRLDGVTFIDSTGLVLVLVLVLLKCTNEKEQKLRSSGASKYVTALFHLNQVAYLLG